MYRDYQPAPDFPTDFLGRRICVNDLIVYPTGGNSARNVLALVLEIKDLRSECTFHTRDGRSYWRCPGWNGYVGPTFFKLKVNRIKEGQDQQLGGRAISIDQLHRVVVVGRGEKLSDIQ